MTLSFWQEHLFHIKLHEEKSVMSCYLTKVARNIKYLFICFNSFSDKKSFGKLDHIKLRVMHRWERGDAYLLDG